MPAKRRVVRAEVMETTKESYWQGLTAIIWAILGCLMFWIPVINLICAVAAIGFGIFGLNTRQKVMSVVSIVTGIIVMFLSMAAFLFYVAVGFFIQANIHEIENFGRVIENQVWHEPDDGFYEWEMTPHCWRN